MPDTPDIRPIPLAAVDTTGWREPDYEFVQRLIERIRDVGLLNPITVMPHPDNDKHPDDDPRYVLVAGRHRLEAGAGLEWEAIRATVLPYDATTAELARISENLDRRDLIWLERAEAVYRWNELLTERGARTTGGRPKHDWQNPATVAGLWTTKGMAEKLGVSDRTVRRYVQLIGQLSQDVRDEARDNPDVANSPHELEALANLPSDRARLNALWFLRMHPSTQAGPNGVEYGHQRMTNRYAHCATCDQAIDTLGWPHTFGSEWRVVHCATCEQHYNQSYDKDQVCSNCGTRREPKPEPATDQAPDPTPDPTPTPPPVGAADPNQAFAQQSTTTSQAMHDQPAPLPRSPHQQAQDALNEVNHAAEYILRLHADELGKQIADDHDPAYMEHARRTARQLQEWVEAFDNELF